MSAAGAPIAVEVRVVARREALRRVVVACDPGRVVAVEATDLSSPETADATWTLTEDDASSLAGGTLDPNVAYMRGRMKTAGDVGAPMRVLPLLHGSALADLRAALSSPGADRRSPTG